MVMIERKRLDKDRKMSLAVLSEFNHSALWKFFMVIQKYLPWSLSFYSLENNPDAELTLTLTLSGRFLQSEQEQRFNPS